jgi:hypothetical protein
VTELQLGRAEILELLGEVDKRMAGRADEPFPLVIVGGSYLALENLRDSTRDIDTASRSEAILRDAIAAIAKERNLPPDWMNDKAYAFRPLGLENEECEVLLDGDGLQVLLPPPNWIFLMKLYAARVSDHEDMVALWPSCSFDSPAEAAKGFARAYPHAPDDPGLANYITQIARAAAQ